ncbi:MAG: C1 family peptidase [Anaerolineales bacterium]
MSARIKILPAIACLLFLTGSALLVETLSVPLTHAISDPAAVYCRDLGYESRILENEDGSAIGACEMPDGTLCEEWDFLAGRCGQEFSYCAQQGYGIRTVSGGEGGFGEEYAVCVDEEGHDVGSVEELSNLREKIIACEGTDLIEVLPASTPLDEQVLAQTVVAPPASFDWRNFQGMDWMTPIRYQGGCGSCWAFAAVGGVEAALNIQNHNPNLDYNLSEQVLVSDCSTAGSCCGGWHSSALEYAVNPGLPDEACMPYADSSCSCAAGCQSTRTCANRCSDWNTRSVRIQGYGSVSNNATAIKQALITYGPLPAAMYISGSYVDGSGILRCADDTRLDHSIVIVGYNDAGGYWIIRNSWGTSWGESGYGKVGYGECNIENYVYYVQASVNNACPTVSGEIRLYDSWNCSGTYVSRSTAGLWDLSSTFNDRAEALAIPSGWSVRLYLHNSEASPSICYTASDMDLWNDTFSDGTTVANQATWARVYTSPNCVDGPGVPVLNSPANGATLERSDNVTLTWNAASGASQYYVEFWGGPNININSGWTTNTSWAIGSQWGGVYQWRVKSRNSSGVESGWSETRTLTIRYGAPSNLSASIVSGSQINLSWSASADAPGNIDGYRIYRNGTPIATVGSSTTTYSNTGLDCGTRYTYEVRAYRGALESNPSNAVSPVTADCPAIPAPPSNVVIAATTAHSITLRWQDNSNNETGFNIYKWGYNGTAWGFYYYASVGANVTTFTDSGLDCNNDFNYYEVSAYNTYGESEHTFWIQGITDACPAVPHDDFASPLVITQTPYTYSGDVSGATSAADDPPLSACNRGPGRATVWYRLTTSGPGMLSADTIGSNYDTMLAVWSGTRSNLTLLGCNDDRPSDLQSEVNVFLPAANTYYIEVAEYAYVAANETQAEGPDMSLHEVNILSARMLSLHVRFTPILPLAPGAYENTNANILYFGAWQTYTGSGPTSNTLHYSTAIGDEATFQINGNRFSLTYTAHINRGQAEIYVDGALYATLNQYNSTLAWQRTWTSGILPGATPHTIRIVHKTGTYIDLDAVTVMNVPPPGPLNPGTYEDTDTNIIYTADWTPYTGSGPTSNTLYYSTALNGEATFQINGNRFSLTYTAHINRGVAEIYVDGALYASLNQYNSSLAWQNVWMSGLLPGATPHTIRIVHKTGAVVDLDAVAVMNVPPPSPLDPGTYENTNTNLLYTGPWQTYTGSGPTNNTLHYSTTIGDDVIFQINGNRFSLTYTGFTNRGVAEIYVDGSLYATLNQYNSSLAWQRTWSSGILPGAAPHTIRIVHKTGAVVDLDAVTVTSIPALPIGVYNNTHASIVYRGAWTLYSATGPTDGNLYYSTAIGNDISFSIEGHRFALIYTGYINRGTVEIYVDGSLYDTLNQYDTSLAWQKQWVSGILAGPGPHVIRLVHKTGAVVDLDGVIVLPGVDAAAPAAITDLAAYLGSYGGNVDLFWTAPGDDGDTGTATRYLVRYAATPILTEADWNAATPVNSGIPAPFPAGLLQSMTVSGLVPERVYYFAVRAEDEEFNRAGLSNSPSAPASLPEPLLPGTYDQTDSRIAYRGTWTTYANASLYGGSAARSAVTGNDLIFLVDGSQFRLIYTTQPDYGDLQIYVEGVLVVTLGQIGPLTYQQSWTSPDLSAYGTPPYVVRLVHVTGTYVELDAVNVLP